MSKSAPTSEEKLARLNAANPSIPGTDDDGTFSLVDPTEPEPESPVSTATAEKPATSKPESNGKPHKKPKEPKCGSAAKRIGVKEPDGELRNIPYKELEFSRNLQMRSAMLDEDTVKRYTEVYCENPKQLPPIRVMEIPQEEADSLQFDSRYVVYNGFLRGEAAKRAKLDKIPCLVAPGNYMQARILALQANHDSALPRTRADLRHVFFTLIRDEPMLEKVLKWGVGKGGPVRSLAAAAGVSKSLVHKILAEMGKHTNRTGIVDLPAGKATAGVDGQHARGADKVGGTYAESKEALAKKATAVILKDMQYAAAGLQRRVESLLAREDAAGLFRETCKKHGYAIIMEETATKGKGRTKKETVEYLPLVDKLLAIMDDMADQHKRLTTDPQAATATEAK